MSTKVIAYYLPQFHPIKENDEWWGKGFTEWTNVGKAKALFKGHYQPRVPSDLGYYDLRLPINKEQQAELAKNAGIHGFCYWHYWFGNGKKLLEKPFEEVLISGKPNFPFCLGWANETWKAKLWNSNSAFDKILIEQLYPNEIDYTNHFNEVYLAFKDERYIKIEDKPVFLIYQPKQHPDLKNFILSWNNLAKEKGFLNGIFFIARVESYEEHDTMLENGFSAVTMDRIRNYYSSKSKFKKLIIRLSNKVKRRPPYTIDYKNAIKNFSIPEIDKKETVFPSIIPCWDHSPRSGKAGTILHNSNPKLFKIHVKKVLDIIKNKEEKHKIVFLKSWNEWAEGNYIEPDLKYGHGYLNVLKEELKK